MAFSLKHCKGLCKSLHFRIINRTLGSSAEKRGLVLGVYSESESDDSNESGIHLTAAAEKFNESTHGKLLESINLVGKKIKEGKSYVFWGLSEEFPAVSVVGLGKKGKSYNNIERICEDKETVRIAAGAGCHALDSVGIKEICIEMLGDAESAAEGSTLRTWKFQEYKSKKAKLPQVNLYTAGTEENDEKQWNRGKIKADAQNFSRRLADTPSNLMTPTIFCENVKKELEDLKDIEIKDHDEEWAREQNMGAFLAVTQGSVQPPKFLEMTYCKGAEDDPLCVLIGKGITFDTGGISLKPAAGMDEMRGDMSGGAALAATLKAIACLEVEANIKVLVPLCENMPSGGAIKPGDVVIARNGKSICVDNTDAEGRLILADTLCYSADFNPKWVLDIATLTGAIRMALGNSAAGVFTNSDKLYEILELAGATTGDRVWRMPLWKHFTKQVADNPAYDVNNVGKGKGGGSCTAAAFLKEFAPPNTDWLHVDMAGVTSPADGHSYLGKGISGRPTRTLIEFIESQHSKR